jgi:hypothetical protein
VQVSTFSESLPLFKLNLLDKNRPNIRAKSI